MLCIQLMLGQALCFQDHCYGYVSSEQILLHPCLLLGDPLEDGKLILHLLVVLRGFLYGALFRFLLLKRSQFALWAPIFTIDHLTQV